MRKTILILSLLALTGLSQMNVKAQDTLVRMKSNATEVELLLHCTPNTATVEVNGVPILSGSAETIPVNGDSTVFITINNNARLTQLLCSYNQLSQLDVSNNTELWTLYCQANSLTALDVSNNTALTALWSSSNQLTKLDVSNNTALQTLYCYDNQLTELDVTNNTALSYLSAYGQQIEVPILSGATTFSNPVFYKTPAGEQTVQIAGAWYAYQYDVPITGNTISFTTNLPAGVTYGTAFGGTITFVESTSIAETETNTINLYPSTGQLRITEQGKYRDI